ncbi:unnamed protein product [Rhizopus stolonifer]
MILAFLGASISLLTFQLDFIVPRSRFFEGGSSAYAAGYTILIIIQFVWVMIFGSDPESYIGRYGPCHYGNTVGVHHSHEGIGEKTINMDPAPAVISEQHSPVINNPPNEPTQPSPVEYREKVQALHAYQANPKFK